MDCAVRVGNRQDSSLVARRIGVFVDWIAELFERCLLLSGVQGAPGEICRLLTPDPAAVSGKGTPMRDEASACVL